MSRSSVVELPRLDAAWISAFDALRQPVWLYYPAARRLLYANPAGLALWDAPDVRTLRALDLAGRVSPEAAAEIMGRLGQAGSLSSVLFHPPGLVSPPECLVSRLSLGRGRDAILAQQVVTTASSGEERRAATMLANMDAAVSLYDVKGQCLYRSPAACRLFPSKKHRFADRFAEPQAGRDVLARLRAGERVAKVVEVRSRRVRRWHEISACRIIDPATALPAYLVHERDVTQMQAMKARLGERERQLDELQEVAHLGDWRYDIGAGRFHFSPELVRIYELDGPSLDFEALFRLIHPEDRQQTMASFEQVALTGRTGEIVFRILPPSGDIRHVWNRWALRRDQPDVAPQMLGVARDVSEEMRSRERIDFLAMHDSVTGLANRVAFTETLAEATRHRLPGGTLVLLDLDGFKEINDSRGHAVGDAVLREVGRRLARQARPSDMIARLGGDEFGVIMPGLVDTAVVEKRAHELLLAVTAPITVDGMQIFVGTSIGISRWPLDGILPDDLQRDADLALYSVKAEGGSGWAAFSREMRVALDERRWSRENLELALKRQELELHYQPIVELGSMQLCGFEALVRWRHPERGLIPPDQFISIAEEAGLMWPLGAFVLRTAVRQLRSWLDMGLEPGRIAINLGGGQVSKPAIVDLVREVLDETGVEPHRLDLEVTETVTLGQRSGDPIANLDALSRLGVGLVLDDFGTGHASLTHLRRLPVNQLKVDRTFVKNIETDMSNAAIVRAVMSLGQSLGIPVVAEGIETREQLRILRDFDCRLGQGYLFSRPMPLAAATSWLIERKSQRRVI